MALVTVEVADLAAASRQLYREVADPLSRSVGDHLLPLPSTAGMAGDDPPARSWAAAYDRAAPAAIAAAEDVINACYRVSAMLGATARNYAAAEAASTVRGHPPAPTITAALATLPDDTRIGLPSSVPSACADVGNDDLPLGWHFVAHHMDGYVWPNGHQDRLHRAARAWQASATALEEHAFAATIVDLGPLVDGLPEGRDIATVCIGLGEHLHAVARAHRGLAQACSQLAAHLDHAHSTIEHELAELLAWSGVIQGVGVVASLFSFGTAEAPTQGAQVARIAATVATVTRVLSAFAAAVRAAAATVGPLADAAADVRAAVAWVREVRIVQVEVTAVPGLRGYEVVRIERAGGQAITTTEMSGSEASAAAHITQASAGADHAARLHKMKQIESKYKHAGDFGVDLPRGKEGFAAFEGALEEFVADPETRAIAGTYRSDPAVLHFNVKTQQLVVVNSDGQFVTAFRMSQQQLTRVLTKGAIGIE